MLRHTLYSCRCPANNATQADNNKIKQDQYNKMNVKHMVPAPARSRSIAFWGRKLQLAMCHIPLLSLKYFLNFSESTSSRTYTQFDK